MNLVARPTTYAGVPMRSRLEAAWAEQFDRLGWGWQYEPFVLAGPAGQYLPDFLVAIPECSTPMVVEVKGGWWLDASAHEGLDDDAITDLAIGDLDRMSTLVAEMAVPHLFVFIHHATDYVRIDVWEPGAAGAQPTWPSSFIGRCANGRHTSLVSCAGAQCLGLQPFAPVELVPSLHVQQAPPQLTVDPIHQVLEIGD